LAICGRLEQLYCIDGRILTSAGGAAATDLFIEIVAKNFGDKPGRCGAEDVPAWPAAACRSAAAHVAVIDLGIRNPVLVEVIRQFEENLEQGVEIEASGGGSLGVSRRQVERLFQRYVGMSPKQYLNGLRLERARALLTETDLPVAEVAYGCGFNATNTFTKAFRQRYGVSPRRLSSRQGGASGLKKRFQVEVGGVCASNQLQVASSSTSRKSMPGRTSTVEGSSVAICPEMSTTASGRASVSATTRRPKVRASG
jgi:AraC-like DNA-binding protein